MAGKTGAATETIHRADSLIENTLVYLRSGPLSHIRQLEI
jgi:hypothetical protein